MEGEKNVLEIWEYLKNINGAWKIKGVSNW
jgi:hypothetical protein